MTLVMEGQDTLPAVTEDGIVRLFAERRMDEARAAAELFVTQWPERAFGWKALATVLGEQGNWGSAILVFKRCAKLLEGDAECAANFGNALRKVGKLAEAEVEFRRAVGIDARCVSAWDGLGCALHQLDRLDEAEECLLRAIALDARRAVAYEHLGNVLLIQCRIPEAESAYRKALELEPGSAKVLNNLGSLLHGASRYAEAERCFREALTLEPEYAAAWNSLGHLMASHGMHAEGEICFREAMRLDAGHAVAHSNLLFSIAHRPDVRAEDLLEEHLRFRERFEAPLRGTWKEHENSREPGRALRVGFVSGDLHDHAVVRYLKPMLEEMAKYDELTLVAYSNDRIEDAVTAELRGLFDEWRGVSLMTDSALAEQIRADGIDVLFDLSGHTGYNRLLALARKPAPVQIGWIGYVGTTGLESMDYFVGDRHFVLQEMEWQFTEKILRLPAGTPFAPYKHSPEVNASPAMTTGTFTFGSFNRVNKLSREVIAVWSRILREASEARLLLAAMPDAMPPERLLRWFAEEGIGAERLRFLGARGVEKTLRLHHGVDLCLDPFPYGGSTTNNHALWMGLPTLTLPRETLASRMGASLAMHVGIPEFVAGSVDEYVAKAVRYAREPERLAEMRPRLRGMFAESVFLQPEVITAALVQGIRAAWVRWCAGLPAETMRFD